MKKKILSTLLLLITLFSLLPSNVLASTVYESNIEYTSSYTLYDVYWRSETFKPSITHEITGVSLLLGSSGSPDFQVLNISIRNTDQAGNISGSDLCGGWLTCSMIEPTGGWLDIPFDTTFELQAGTEYAIVASAPTATAAIYPKWYFKNSDSYANGVQTNSSDSGVTWVQNNTQDFAFQEYGGEVASTAVQLSATTGTVTSTITGDTPFYFFYGSTSNLSSLHGFQIGLNDGSWDNFLKLEELAISGDSSIAHDGWPIGTWNGTAGNYMLPSTSLSSNTTYYYRAYTGIFTTSTGWYYAYGSTANFTTSTIGFSSTLPILTTDSVVYTISNNQGTLQASGTIISSTSTVIERGFRWSLTSSNMSDLTGQSSNTGIFNTGYFAKVMSASTSAGIPYPAGTTIYIQAFAKNALGNTGYGNILTYIVPVWEVSQGVYITNNLAVVNGNTAKLSATITNPLNITISKVGFAWGETIACSDSSINMPVTGSNPTQFSYTLTNLSDTTVYFFKSGVYISGGWVWSQPTTFTTGATIPIVTGTSPTVTTLSATNIGQNFFQANGNLISEGSLIGSNVTILGFAYAFDTNEAVEDWARISNTGDFSTGAFNKIITLSKSSVTVYFSAYAENQYSPAFGQIFYVNLLGGSGGGVGGGTGTDNTSTSVPSDISNWVIKLANAQGMTNAFGHWAFMAEIILAILVLFGIPILLIPEENVRKILAYIMLALVVVVIGAFIFTGWLGIWPLIFLGAGVVIIIIIVISLFANRGNN